jgi:aminoglycoside phosphotransferase family enzyme/predicted kinase
MSGQADVIAFLSNPASYGGNVDAVERHETHGAIVFLAGDRAYKLKREVRYPYMNFSTVALRGAACRAELSVNRRTAPHLYLDVRAIVRRADGVVAFAAPDRDGSVADWVVVMRRFDQSALLSRLCERGELTEAVARDLAEAVAGFHASAERVPGDGARAIVAVIDENCSKLRSYAGAPFEQDKIASYGERAGEALRRWQPLLERRAGEGFVRRCHGDLHLNNICLLDGEPVLFDAIEFNERFSVIDTLYDLAFLLMDLEHRGRRGFASVVLNRYLECSDDYEGTALLPLFLSCRAAIRAHVSASYAATARPGEAEKARADGARFLDDAIALLATPAPVLVTIGGLSGTGKSTLARRIAPQLGSAPGAVILRTDVLRKRLSGTRETDRLPESAYQAAMNARVYRALGERIAHVLAGGHCAIADAVFGDEGERIALALIAAKLGVHLKGVWLEAPVPVLEDRVRRRRGDASDATVAVLHRQLQTLVPPEGWTRIDVSGDVEESFTRLRAALASPDVGARDAPAH